MKKNKEDCQMETLIRNASILLKWSNMRIAYMNELYEIPNPAFWENRKWLK